jgi:hypothetical protein
VEGEEVAKIIQFPVQVHPADVAAKAVSENIKISPNGKLQPKSIIIQSVAEWNDGPRRDALLKLWQLGVDQPSPEMDHRTLNEVASLAEYPSQLFSLSLDIPSQDETLKLLGGHYGYNRRDDYRQIEMEFDRSFHEGLGLHRLAIDFRLYIACVDNVLSGQGASPLKVSYASVNSTNPRSMNNFIACGAERFGFLPKCLRYDDENSDLIEPGLEFAIFSPEASCKGFFRFKEVLEKGYLVNGVSIKVLTAHPFTQLEFANGISPDVLRMTKVHEWFLSRARREGIPNLAAIR